MTCCEMIRTLPYRMTLRILPTADIHISIVRSVDGLRRYAAVGVCPELVRVEVDVNVRHRPRREMLTD